jgi:pantetheine-phosphate adenylyltransferase
MRITGGELTGRRIRAPHSDARPTADRVRESVFMRLGPLAGRRVLDLFAGSGALGLEAVSRGASEVLFVDRVNAAVACVGDNLAALGSPRGASVQRGDALKVLRKLGREGRCFDLVFVDPPYASDLAARVLAALPGLGILAPGAEVVVESDRRHPPGDFEGLVRQDERRYGDTVVTRYGPAEPEPSRDPEGAPRAMPEASPGLALFPASFDPLTNGHLDLVHRARSVFPRLIVAVAHNVTKAGTFNVEERVEILEEVLADLPDVQVAAFEGLVVDYATQIGASTIIRGLRANADFQYEFEMALMNRHMRPDIETLFLMTSQEFFYVSSSRLKELVQFGADISEWVPPAVAKKLREKLGQG